MIYSLQDGYFVRTFQEGDLSGPYLRWFEDQEVCRFNSHGKYFKTAAFYRNFYNGLNGEDAIVWAICHEKDGHIGNVSLQGISAINRTGEFAILIGDKRHWGKGVAYRATHKLFEHGFFKLNLERMHCSTPEPNMALISLVKRLGMVEEGRRRQHLFFEGKRVDMIEFGMLEAEFKYERSSVR